MSNSIPLPVRAKLFHGFADMSRLAILQALWDGPLSVTGILDATGLSQSNASNHLRCLRDCDLVTCAQDGRFVYYQLSDPRVAELLHLADDLLREVAIGVEACARYNVEEEPDGALATG